MSFPIAKTIRHLFTILIVLYSHDEERWGDSPPFLRQQPSVSHWTRDNERLDLRRESRACNVHIHGV